MKKIILLAIIVVFSAGCERRTTTGYKQNMDRWIGKTEAEGLMAFGTPSSVYTADNGIKYVQYGSKRTTADSISATTNYYSGSSKTSFTNISGTTYWCKTTAEIKNGIITNITFRGNNCLAKEIK